MKVDIYKTNKRYGVIYADPPWLYKDRLKGDPKMGATPYPCMTQTQLHALPVAALAEKDCVLFM